MSSTVAKPNLRKFHNATIKRNLLGMFTTVAIVVTAFHYLVKIPRKQQYAEFYRQYDAEKSAERMREAGLFQSAPPSSSD